MEEEEEVTGKHFLVFFEISSRCLAHIILEPLLNRSNYDDFYIELDRFDLSFSIDSQLTFLENILKSKSSKKDVEGY